MKKGKIEIKFNKNPQTLAAVHTHTHTHLTTRGPKNDAIFASKNNVKKTIYENFS